MLVHMEQRVNAWPKQDASIGDFWVNTVAKGLYNT